MWRDVYVRHKTHAYVTGLVCLWAVTHSYEIWLIRMWRDVIVRRETHLYVTCLVQKVHDSFVCEIPYEIWPIRMWRDVIVSRETNLCVTCLVQKVHDSFICDIPYSCETWLSYTGWRRPIECLISMRHFPQKSPVISGSFVENDLQRMACYGSSPPCMRHDPFIWGMTRSYVTRLIHTRHDSFIRDMTHSCETWLTHIRRSFVTRPIRIWYASFVWDVTICKITHSYDITHSYET